MGVSWWWLLAGVVVLGLLVSFVDAWGRSDRGPRGRRRPPRGPGGARAREPRPGEIWWALVPFEDGPGAKDRPCLVLSVGPRAARVMKITSRQHPERDGVVALPPGAVDDREGRRSYLETLERRKVPLRDFRRRAGAVDAGVWERVRKG
ncbi:type II toxin-antitoxin system PemK/MazF family toxin [Streptomyces sp. NPDC006684]|uniref:type II toxin-antitoxin system PemK/MazF family toxin n=1 Tax=Streptomyces sp. NPDC006684 TaxID=3154477 RepID=UPI003453E9A8